MRRFLRILVGGILTGAVFFVLQARFFQEARASSELERYLELQYQAEFFVREFETELDRLAREKADFPEREIHPLETNAYAHLLALWPEVVLETHRLAHVYGEAAQRRENVRLERFQRWLDALTEADRLQVLPLFLKLAEYEGMRSRFPSWFENPDLEDRMRANEAEIVMKAKRAANSAVARREQPDEQGSGVSPSKGPSVYPSPDAPGNFIGRQLDEGVFVLTFDDGPGPASTSRLHKILTAHTDQVNRRGAPATFFVLIEKAYTSPQVLEATRQLGFNINNHSWTHPNFAKLGQEELRRQIVDSTHELQKFIGGTFRFFRCPYGACFAPKVPAARKLIADQNLIHAYWTIDSVDWKNIGRPERTMEIVIKEMKLTKRGVILLHDIHESSVDATQKILGWIQSQNASGADLRLVDLEDAVDRVNRR